MNKYEYIQSRDLRDYIKYHDIEINDATLAAIIYHNNSISYNERNNALQEIQETTSNEVLKEQIMNRLLEDNMNIEKLKQASSYTYYSLTVDDESHMYVYKTFNSAYQEGLEVKSSFRIRKQLYEEYEFYESVIENLKEEIIGTLHFDKDGVLLSDISLYKAGIARYPNKSSFEDMYIDLPYVFREGDVVKCLNDNSYGVVSSLKDRADVEEYSNIARRGDYIDYSVTVLPIDKDMKVQSAQNHIHISPLNLEKADLRTSTKNKILEEYYRAMEKNEEIKRGLRTNGVLYFIMSGYDEFHDGDEWYGIYTDVENAKYAYQAASRMLKTEQEDLRFATSEKGMVHIFNEVTREWQFNVSPEELF